MIESINLAMGESSPVKVRCSLTNSIWTAFVDEHLHNPAQVIQVAGKPVHTMHDDGIAAAHKTHHQFKLWAFGIFAGYFVSEGFIDLNAIQLALCVLVKGAHANIANALSAHNAPECVKLESETLG
jgi:hypothetical protein